MITNLLPRFYETRCKFNLSVTVSKTYIRRDPSSTEYLSTQLRQYTVCGNNRRLR